EGALIGPSGLVSNERAGAPSPTSLRRFPPVFSSIARSVAGFLAARFRGHGSPVGSQPKVESEVGRAGALLVHLDGDDVRLAKLAFDGDQGAIPGGLGGAGDGARRQRRVGDV